MTAYVGQLVLRLICILTVGTDIFYILVNMSQLRFTHFK